MHLGFLGYLVAELGVRLQPPLVHALEHGYARIHVIVDDNVVLALTLAVQASRVLRDDALPGIRRGEKQRVELRQVESLADVAASCDDRVADAGRAAHPLDPLALLARRALAREHEGLDARFLQALRKFGCVLLALRDNERRPS